MRVAPTGTFASFHFALRFGQFRRNLTVSPGVDDPHLEYMYMQCHPA